MLRMILKDLKIHARPVAYYFLVAAAFPFVLLLANGWKANPTFFDASFFTVIISPIMIGQWLISSEKIKRTLFLLRMLPVSTRKIFGAKEACAALIIVAIATFSVLSTFLCIQISNGWEIVRLPSARAWVWLALGIAFFTQVVLLTHLTFDQRLASQVPFGGLFLLLILFGVMSNYFPEKIRVVEKAFNNWLVIFAAAVVALGGMILIHEIGARVLSNKDWSRSFTE
jgi:TRAP-type C4-dicarboxylate transport system permease small subunit